MHERGDTVTVGLVRVHSVLLEEAASQAEVPGHGSFGELQGHWEEVREGEREEMSGAVREGGRNVEGEIGGGVGRSEHGEKERRKRRGTVVR